MSLPLFPSLEYEYAKYEYAKMASELHNNHKVTPWGWDAHIFLAEQELVGSGIAPLVWLSLGLTPLRWLRRARTSPPSSLWSCPKVLQKDLQLVCMGRAAPSLIAMPSRNVGTGLPATEHIKQEAGRKRTYPSVQFPCCEGHPRTFSQARHCFMGPQISKPA